MRFQEGKNISSLHPQNSRIGRNAMAVFPDSKDRYRGETNKLLHAPVEHYEVQLFCCPFKVAAINSSNKYLDCRLAKKKSNYHETLAWFAWEDWCISRTGYLLVLHSIRMTSGYEHRLDDFFLWLHGKVQNLQIGLQYGICVCVALLLTSKIWPNI